MAIRAVCRNLMQDGLYILLGTLAFSLPPRFGSLRVLRRECCCASLVVQREARVMLVSPAVQLHLSLRCKHAAFAVQLLVGSVSLLKNGSHSAFLQCSFTSVARREARRAHMRARLGRKILSRAVCRLL